MKIKINFFSDTICGWCYIGHARLMKAIQSFHNINFEIEHIPFQLNPEMPREGIDREYYLQMKFGGKENAQPMYDHMMQEGIKEGLNINLEKIKKTPNTVLSHLLILQSKNQNLQNEIKEKLFKYYFEDGIDIGDENVIEKLKKEIPKIKFNLKELNSEKSKNEIIAKSTIAKTLGINGVPFFQFNKGYLSGAQPVENLEIAIKDNLV